MTRFRAAPLCACVRKNIVILTGVLRGEDEIGAFPLTVQQWARIASGNGTLRLFGHLEYVDVLDSSRVHTHGFAVRMIYTELEFQPVCLGTHWYHT